jgi:MFS family permease
MAHARSARALDMVNFFVGDLQTGFGPFIAVYLTANKWTEGQIGVALSLGTISALIGQVPAGALVDALHNKRLAAMVGVVAISFSALLFALFPLVGPVYLAELLHGIASCVLTPSIAAVSLALVGHAALGERLGRNARFASIGNGIAAGVMGVIGSTVSPEAVFWLTTALGAPALIALAMIGRVEPAERPLKADPFDWHGLRDLVADRRVLAFGLCALLFHLSNAAMLPFAAASVTKTAGDLASMIVGACIVVPQIVVALMSPWVGARAETWGRRPLLVLGWAMLAVRGVLIALVPNAWLLIALQALSGVSGAVFGVMFPLISADITVNSGRFNLCMGVLGLAVFVGASLSTMMAGWTADHFGDTAAFMMLAAAGLAGALACRFVMPETRPSTQPAETSSVIKRRRPAS